MKNSIRQFKDIQNHNWHTSFLLTSSGTFLYRRRQIKHPDLKDRSKAEKTSKPRTNRADLTDRKIL